MSINPNQCTSFVQVWADVNALRQGTTNGCYAVCTGSLHSSGEGTANLTTQVAAGSYICWSVLPIEPQYNGTFAISQVGASSGWSAPPAAVPGSPNLFTGQLTRSTGDGNVNSTIVFSYNTGGPSITVTVPVTIIPVAY